MCSRRTPRFTGPARRRWTKPEHMCAPAPVQPLVRLHPFAPAALAPTRLLTCVASANHEHLPPPLPDVRPSSRAPQNPGPLVSARAAPATPVPQPPTLSGNGYSVPATMPHACLTDKPRPIAPACLCRRRWPRRAASRPAAEMALASPVPCHGGTYLLFVVRARLRGTDRWRSEHWPDQRSRAAERPGSPGRRDAAGRSQSTCVRRLRCNR